MSDMAAAMAKAGLISQKQADQVDLEKQNEATNKAKDQKVKERNTRPKLEITTPYKQFDEMWDNPKSRKFVKHLIWSFGNTANVDKIWGSADDYDTKCCICQVGTMSINQTMGCVEKDAGESLLKHCKFVIANQGEKNTEEYKKNYETFTEEIKNDVFNGKVLGLVGVESKKVFCFSCYEKFHSWIIERLMRGDKDINGMIKSLRNKPKQKRDNGI